MTTLNVEGGEPQRDSLRHLTGSSPATQMAGKPAKKTAGKLRYEGVRFAQDAGGVVLDCMDKCVAV